MIDYTFSTLNDKEFEEITKVLLNAEYKLGLRSYPVGRDKGIDLRKSSASNKNEIVVQVKHYINSKYSNLKNILLKEEISKLKKIKPSRYILVTSLKLTVKQKDDIYALLKPYVLSIDDIFSQSDLNDLLNNHKSVERRFYKLWLSSTHILQTILNNATESRTQYFLESLSKKMKLYVATNKINTANEILKNEKILLITGEPGVGKTTLAEILIFNRAKWGYKIHVVEDIIEAEDIISNDNEKQMFYFDDFLGANYTEIINSHRTETRLTNFVERIYNTPNKYIVLTTRTVILNYAFDSYEKISNSKLNIGKFELKVGDYTRLEKAQILYNHLYFQNVERKYYNVILKNKFYYKIIEHKSYRPRIIEFITDKHRIKSFTNNQYEQFILNNLENPEGIWKFSFNNQIKYLDKCLLLTLFTYEGPCSEQQLKIMFDARLDYEKNQNNQIIETNQFHKSLNVLSNGFVKIITYNYTSFIDKKIQFINPSLTDFLINYVSNSVAEMESILKSAIYSEQLKRFNPKQRKITITEDLEIIISERIEQKAILDLVGDTNNIYIKTISILLLYCTNLNIDYSIYSRLLNINLLDKWDEDFGIKFIDIMNDISKIKHPQSFNFIYQNFEVVIRKIFASVQNELYSSEILDLFRLYDYNYTEFKSDSENLLYIHEYINQAIRDEEQNHIESLTDTALDIGEAQDIYDHFNDKMNELIEQFDISIYIDAYIPKFDKSYWEAVIDQNKINEQIAEAEKSQYKYEDKATQLKDSKNENYMIDRLFH